MTVNEANNIIATLNKLLSIPDKGGKSGDKNPGVMDIWRMGVYAAGIQILKDNSAYAGMKCTEDGERFRLIGGT